MSDENKITVSWDTDSKMTVPAEDTGFAIYKPKVPVGYWVLYPGDEAYSFQIAIYRKPTDEQIKNTEQLLGWGWKDAGV